MSRHKHKVLRHARTIQPYQQGHLDGFCGAYSIVNAAHFVCGPFKRPEAMALLREILALAHRRVSVVERLSFGMTLQDVSGAMRHVLDPRYPIRRCLPFRGHASVGLGDYWATLDRFAAQRRGVVLTAFGGRINHWTVIRDVTHRSLLLFDSDGRHRVARRCCVMASDSPMPGQYTLHPTYTYFLWVDRR